MPLNLHRCVTWQGKVLRVQLLCFLIWSIGCAVPQKRADEDSVAQLVITRKQPLTVQQSEDVLGVVAENWLYGPGLGRSALNIGTIVLFPPYAVYVLGNALLDVSGFQPLYLTDLLPEDERQDYNKMFDSVTGAPGRVTAAMAGKEFRSPEAGRQRLENVLAPES